MASASGWSGRRAKRQNSLPSGSASTCQEMSSSGSRRTVAPIANSRSRSWRRSGCTRFLTVFGSGTRLTQVDYSGRSPRSSVTASDLGSNRRSRAAAQNSAVVDMSVESRQRSFQRARGMAGNATRLWQAGRMSTSEPRAAHGTGLASVHRATGDVLDVWFPEPALGPLPDDSDFTALDRLVGDDDERDTTRQVVRVETDLDAEPRDTADVWLRLHLLSHRLVRPHGVELTGVFGMLTNVVWTN